MALPTLAAFSYNLPEEFFVTVDGTVVSQTKAVNGSTRADKPKVTLRRLGDSTAATLRKTPSYNSTCTLTLYSEAGAADALAILGASPAQLDASTSHTIRVEVYDTSTGTIDHSWQLDNAFVSEASIPNTTADGDSADITFNFESDDRWILTTGA